MNRFVQISKLYKDMADENKIPKEIKKVHPAIILSLHTTIEMLLNREFNANEFIDYIRTNTEYSELLEYLVVATSAVNAGVCKTKPNLNTEPEVMDLMDVSDERVKELEIGIKSIVSMFSGVSNELKSKAMKQAMKTTIKDMKKDLNVTVINETDFLAKLETNLFEKE